MRENKGITLIALVITIIVLLILAGVSIAMLSGNNSILKNAQTARNEYGRKTLDEVVKLAVGGITTDYRGWPAIEGSSYPVRAGVAEEGATGTVADADKIGALLTEEITKIAGTSTFDATPTCEVATDKTKVTITAKVDGKTQVVEVAVATGAVTEITT